MDKKYLRGLDGGEREELAAIDAGVDDLERASTDALIAALETCLARKAAAPRWEIRTIDEARRSAARRNWLPRLHQAG